MEMFCYFCKKGMRMQVNTEMLWNTLKQMVLYTKRKEELLQQLEWILVQCSMFEKMSGYKELKRCENAMKQEIQRKKEIQQVLERIIQNYEQTEERLLRLQEEGTKSLEHTKISCINVTEISCFLKRWNLTGE